MDKTNRILLEFLREAGWNEPIKAGDEQAKPIADGLKNKLIDQLVKESQFNRILVMMAALMFCGIFLLGVFFAFYYRDEPKIMGVIFGGTFFTMLGIVSSLRKLWFQKCKMDLLLTVVPNISNDQAGTVIETLIYEKPISR